MLGFHQQIPRVAIQCCMSAERDGRVGKTNYFESPRMISDSFICVQSIIEFVVCYNVHVYLYYYVVCTVNLYDQL